MSADPLRHELDEAGVLLLTLNRPEARNALDDELTTALSAALNDAADDPGTRAIILTGAGEAFCAGGDLGRFEREWTPSAFRLHSHRLTALIEGIELLEKPVIAAINGAVTGAGTQLALACDVRLAAASARMIFREGRLGIIPSHGGVTRLVKLVGLARARDVLLGGEELSAAEGERFGLLSAVVPDGTVVQAAQERARLALRRSAEAYAAAKRLLAIAADTSLRAGMTAEAFAQSSLIATAEHREAVSRARARRTSG
ncbi:MAG: enoyl-CoA hydratase/isomerase family protein [Solirubrobacterales bacterium]|nr:enoyl-CoA hydratase/isomerase family protein [Solirubrobacterales bacterium]MBV9916518.1 enoyl-CoA hydratase/isomerase family protein [Solirubrobacterales bacterium]